ncbi:MAG: aldo/keto reductase [Anaerolineales bacterium]|nr:aldo/keto reductase [Anaerolineales bacterium]
MKYRKLGKTDLNVSVIGVGTWQFGGEWGKAFTPAEVKRLLDRAGELGINLIDTAECYGDHLSEALIGQAIEGERDKWIVATKFGHKFPCPFERIDQWSPQEVQQQLEESLRALRTETIDLYQFHSGSDQVFDQEELWSMLQRQIQAGKIRYLGISVSSRIDPLYQTRRAAEVGASAIQVIYNRLDRSPEEQLFPVCQAQNLGVLARVPLASGLLSGKYQPGAEFTQADDVRSRQDKADVQAKLKQVQEIQQNEAPPDVPLAAWALAWCLQHPALTAVIPGCKTIAQVELNASAADL